MKKGENQNLESEIFLGVDGGQSHTEAVIADKKGNILGRGIGGASNHAEVPGGRERLRNAILDSVGEALKIQDSRFKIEDSRLKIQENFVSAHFGMTGGADYKQEIIGEIIKAKYLTVGHDAPTALFGATAGKAGIVVIAGTGSVVYGENETGETARAGGLGFLFSDEGSGFWLAAQTIRLAIKEQDNLIENCGLQKLVLDFFGREKLRQITDDFYNEKISRDDIAKLARAAHDEAMRGHRILADEINYGCAVLSKQVRAVADKLKFAKTFPVSGIGGMFQGEFFYKIFIKKLSEINPPAEFTKPRFGPAIGALLLAYKQAGVEIKKDLLNNLEKTQIR